MCLTLLNEVISIIYIITIIMIMIIIIIIIIIIINYFIIMATICCKKAWGTNLFIWPKLFIRHWVIQECSCQLDSKIVFNPWNNNFDWGGWDENFKNCLPFCHMLFTFTSLE